MDCVNELDNELFLIGLLQVLLDGLACWPCC